MKNIDITRFILIYETKYLRNLSLDANNYKISNEQLQK